MCAGISLRDRFGGTAALVLGCNWFMIKKHSFSLLTGCYGVGFGYCSTSQRVFGAQKIPVARADLVSA